MPSAIPATSSIPLPDLPALGSPTKAGGNFQEMLAQAIGGVEHLRGDARQTAERFLAGEGEEVHTVALAAQRAELALETFVQVRNKLVSAYQAIMQMQI